MMEVCRRKTLISNRTSGSSGQSSSDNLYDHHHSSSTSALVNSSAANATLAFANNLQNQLPSYAAQLVSMPSNNFYPQISVPRNGHSNRNNVAAQFAALQQAVADQFQFQTAAALCVPSIFNQNSQQHHGNNSANLGYQNLNSPAKQIAMVQQHPQQFQPSLLNQQQLFVPQWPPLSNAQRALAMQQHNQLMLHAQDPLNLDDLTENVQESAVIYDQLSRNANYINSQQNAAMWNMVSAQPAHQSMINSSRQAQSTIRQPLPAHLSSSTSAAMAIATHQACVAAALSNSNNCNSRCNKQKQHLNTTSSSSQLSPAKKRIKESSPPKWSSSRNELSNSGLHFGNSNKLIYGRNQNNRNINNFNNSNSLYLDNNYSSVLLNSPCMSTEEENWRGVLRQEMMGNENLLNSGHMKEKTKRNHQTITLSDTPSPNNSVVSVITISDSDEDNNVNSNACSSSNFAKDLKISHKNQGSVNSHSNNSSANNLITSSTCESVLPLTPNEDQLYHKLTTSSSFVNKNKPLDNLRKNAISNSQLLRQGSSDSDSDLISSSFSPLRTLPNFTNVINSGKVIIKPEPMANSSHQHLNHSPSDRIVIESKKKRILSKSQSLSYDGGLNQVAFGGQVGGSTSNLNSNSGNKPQHQQLYNLPQIQIDQIATSTSSNRKQDLEEEKIALDAHLLSSYSSSNPHHSHLHTSSSSSNVNQLQNQLQNQLLTGSASSLDNLAHHNFPAATQSSRFIKENFIKLEKCEHHPHERVHTTNKCPTNLTTSSSNCLKSRNQLASNLYATTTDQPAHPLSVSQQQLNSLHYLVNPTNLITADPFYSSSQSSNYPSQNYTLTNANPSYSSKYHHMTIQPPPAHLSSTSNHNTSMNQSIAHAAFAAANQLLGNQLLTDAAAASAIGMFQSHSLQSNRQDVPNNNLPLPAHIAQNPNNPASNLHQFHNLYGYNMGAIGNHVHHKTQPYPSLLW